MNASPPERAEALDRRKVGAIVLVVFAVVGAAVAWKWRSNQGPIATLTPVSASDPRATVTCGIINCHNCPPPRSGISCTVAHRQGPSPVEVCWDSEIVCRNGSVATAHACQSVRTGATEHKVIPTSALVGASQCEKPRELRVTHLTVSPG
jgi:hypothetical protein